MKADLTRDTFRPFQHFTRVLMQQGRVQLDADWNEQAAILLHYLQALAADLIGPYGGPAANLGFQIADSTGNTDFDISPGHYYVDGILCELPALAAPVPITKGAADYEFKVADSSMSFSEKQPILLSAEGQSVWTTVLKYEGDGKVTVPNVPDPKKVLNASHPYLYSKFVTYRTQPDYPNPPSLQSGKSLIYLDVWERLITYIEDDSIREVALNG